MKRVIFLFTFVLSIATHASTEKLIFEGKLGHYEGHCLNGGRKQVLKSGEWKFYRISTNQVLGYEIYQKLINDKYTFIASCSFITREDL